MKTAAEYPVGRLFIYNRGHYLFERTVIKVAEDRWEIVSTKLNTIRFENDEWFDSMMGADLLTEIWDTDMVGP